MPGACRGSESDVDTVISAARVEVGLAVTPGRVCLEAACPCRAGRHKRNCRGIPKSIVPDPEGDRALIAREGFCKVIAQNLQTLISGAEAHRFVSSRARSAGGIAGKCGSGEDSCGLAASFVDGDTFAEGGVKIPVGYQFGAGDGMEEAECKGTEEGVLKNLEHRESGR